MKYGFVDLNTCKETGKIFDVFVDGRIQRNVIEADDKKGFVTRHLINKDGELVIKNDEIVCETIRGSVEIVAL